MNKLDKSFDILNTTARSTVMSGNVDNEIESEPVLTKYVSSFNLTEEIELSQYLKVFEKRLTDSNENKYKLAIEICDDLSEFEVGLTT